MNAVINGEEYDLEIHGEFTPGEEPVYRYANGGGDPGSPDRVENVVATLDGVEVELSSKQYWEAVEALRLLGPRAMREEMHANI